jgi:rhodanese-related sulfurtransferase
MLAARVDIETITQVTNVDPKTVQRWIRGRVPHTRHRWKIADLLDVSEQELWPNEHDETLPDTSEIVAAYGRRSDAPASAWRQLFMRALI